MKNSTVFYPQIQATADGGGIITHGGTVLATRTAELSGLTDALRTALAPWRKPLATHDPAKILLDLATSLIVGGDCLADISMVRGRPDVFGLVASDPTVSRLIATLAADPERAVNAIRAARAAARQRVWSLAADQAPDHGRSAKKPLIIDIDATLVTAHSEKEQAKPTYKRGFGFHPLMAFIDHGPDGTGEAAAAILRPGNAGSNTAADHITLTQKILQQVPGMPRSPVPAPATSTCIRRSTGSPALPIPRRYPTRRPPRQSGSCTAHGCSSPPTASCTSTAWSPTTGPATGRRTSRKCSTVAGISGSPRTRLVTTGRWSATTGFWPKSSSTPASGPVNGNAPRPCRCGMCTITIIARILPSVTGRPRANSGPVSPTS